ncbi:MAG: ATP-binding protein [Legionellaceae bacterium]|nr:ATP-binding protein [Legionellaceae bacterium]
MDQQDSIDLFPLSIASGEAFCNRVDETSRLVHCIEHRRPVLLVSPRRYGKTSLALHAIKKSKLPYAHIDFFSAVDELDIQRAILNGVSKLIASMESFPKKALALATDIFEGSRVRAVVSKLGFSLEIDSKVEKPSQHILDVLERLEDLAVKTNKKLVLFFDEFQCIGELAPDQAMEGVLRQVAQLTKSISFIFSGSNRHLLNQLFDDRKRPFYKLCERISLDRIHQEDYQIHIENSAKMTWGSSMEIDALERIFSITERHPYYLNLLCSRLMYEKKKPTINTIESMWIKYVSEERSHVASELDLLSKNQKKLLTILARSNGTSAPLGKDFIHLSKMSKTTIDQSMTFLERHDYVKKNDGLTTVLDPLIKSALSGNYILT